MGHEYRPEKWYREIPSPDEPVKQGDQLFDVTLHAAVESKEEPGEYDIQRVTGDFIVVTQSCDIEQRKIARIEVAPVYPLTEWLYFQPLSLNDLEAIRNGYSYRYYLLPGWPDAPFGAAKHMRIVEFDQKQSISWDDLERARRGSRLGLCSPYIEHLGQAVARFYMRVGLPEDMPSIEFKAIDQETGRKGEQKYLTNDTISRLGDFTGELELDELPLLAAPLKVIIQKLGFPAHAEVVFKARLKDYGNYFGVGADPDQALSSLSYFLLQEYSEASRSTWVGSASNWIRSIFKATSA